MKTRLVWCIHIVALLFSVLILAVSAVSYYYGAILEWTSGITNTRTTAFISEGYLAVKQKHGIVWAEPFHCILRKEIDINGRIEEFASVCQERKHFLLNIRYFASVSEDGGILFSLTVMPLWIFVSLPMAWLSGFYLFKLLRRFRAGRSDSPTPQSVLDVPSDRRSG
jgi:hypothetical protein